MHYDTGQPVGPEVLGPDVCRFRQAEMTTHPAGPLLTSATAYLLKSISFNPHTAAGPSHTAARRKWQRGCQPRGFPVTS
jgi:hypothetical protein